MKIELVKGQYVSFSIYKGTDNVEAKCIKDFLLFNWGSKTPVQLDGTNFKILIHDVELREYPNINDLIYKITLKGELL